MLIRSLSQSSSPSVLSTDRIFEILNQVKQASATQSLDFDLAAIVAKEANVEAVLAGNISRHGDSLQINVRVHVDKSATDKPDDPYQPAVLGWHAGDTFPML